jgi:hypothetical protein
MYVYLGLQSLVELLLLVLGDVLGIQLGQAVPYPAGDQQKTELVSNHII